MGSFCLFATHFHELAELKKQVDFIYNMHANAVIDQGELILTHEIVDGPATQVCLFIYFFFKLKNFLFRVMEFMLQK